VHFSYVGAIPEPPSLGDSPVQFDPDTAMPVREAIPGLGYALELRAYRTGGVMYLDWWYDNRRVQESVVHTIAEGFATAVMDVVRAALAEEDAASEGEDEMTLVELS
jgi:phthiocerol/phenolphthiocerol synthesis type-I polyketide synthase E